MTFSPMRIALTKYMVNLTELRLLTKQVYKSTIPSADDLLQVTVRLSKAI